MEDLPLWLTSRAKATNLLAEVDRRLARRGLRTRRLDADAVPPEGPGLVLFEENDQALRDWLERHARNRRIVAVAAIPEALAREDIWRLLDAGASDILCWSTTHQPTKWLVARLRRWREVDRHVEAAARTGGLVGHSQAWLQALRHIAEVARFTESPILITGETGTGKELVAHWIHHLNPAAGKLVLVDCSTLRKELAGSELFGHERGAFTHAVARREGALARADGGTLFLDEVGELPLDLQVELLRVVQEGTYKRLGSDDWCSTRFRLVCATLRDLSQEVEAGRFRHDLYHRLTSWVCPLPSLSLRRADVPLLARHFFSVLARGTAPDMDPLVMDFLNARSYPGNVRELQQLVGRIWLRHVGDGPVIVGDIPEDDRPERPGVSVENWRHPLEDSVRSALTQGVGLQQIRTEAADAAVLVALDEAPDQKGAARRLGITPRAVQMRLAAMRERNAEPSEEP